jgi:hypothetical protein
VTSPPSSAHGSYGLGGRRGEGSGWGTMAPTFGVSGAGVDLAGGDKHEADLGAALVSLSFFLGFFWTFSGCGGAVEFFLGFFFFLFFFTFPIVGVSLGFFSVFFWTFADCGGAVEFFSGFFLDCSDCGGVVEFFFLGFFFLLFPIFIGGAVEFFWTFSYCGGAVVFSWVSFWTFSD